MHTHRSTNAERRAVAAAAVAGGGGGGGQDSDIAIGLFMIIRRCRAAASSLASFGGLLPHKLDGTRLNVRNVQTHKRTHARTHAPADFDTDFVRILRVQCGIPTLPHTHARRAIKLAKNTHCTAFGKDLLRSPVALSCPGEVASVRSQLSH